MVGRVMVAPEPRDDGVGGVLFARSAWGRPRRPRGVALARALATARRRSNGHPPRTRWARARRDGRVQWFVAIARRRSIADPHRRRATSRLVRPELPRRRHRVPA